MKLLEEYIKNEGKIINGNILKVDQFINHQINPSLMMEIGLELANYFKDKEINKILTIETSGIAPALMCALKMDLPLVFAKKSIPSTMNESYHTKVKSFTKNKINDIVVAKEFINKEDKILFIDDFLANGEAFKGIEDIINQAGAQIMGVGIIIDKTFQSGHEYIINQGYDLLSLAKIRKLEDGDIEFLS